MKRIYIPIAWEIVFVVATIIWPKQAFHLFFAFYFGLLTYFYFIYKQFSFRKLYKNFGRVLGFWVPVAITFIGLLLAGKLRMLISSQFSFHIDEGAVSIIVHNDLVPTFFYALMMIVIKPVAEELFFRKALIRFDNKKQTIIFAVLSLVLCALTRAHGPLGILEWAIMALPVTIAYIATKNIYISVMAHVLFEFYDNIYEVLYTVGRILKR
ncbi:CPBP family intramembrane glutamic endopeptidase [Butyrivibrio sp.]|uniref:CPBP family intramembrane glutamic endopeptidase n=1 Tax=Butyrivibrio sp. TaxID=28121 RepID=UPI0025C198D8|nr:CPBP family intramembrane glutamic endopeptidase [Butyrivibrio sp.]MBQ9303258.1 CPBP family intramembrane metalloprotease [Butyrivibrio sp.]